MDDMDRTHIVVASRDRRERVRLLGESWQDWKMFEFWEDTHPSVFTSAVRRASAEERLEVAGLLKRLRQLLEDDIETRRSALAELDVRIAEKREALRKVGAEGLRARDQLRHYNKQLARKTEAEVLSFLGPSKVEQKQRMLIGELRKRIQDLRKRLKSPTLYSVIRMLEENPHVEEALRQYMQSRRRTLQDETGEHHG